MTGFSPPILPMPTRIAEITSRFGQSRAQLGQSADALVFGKMKSDAQGVPGSRTFKAFGLSPSSRPAEVHVPYVGSVIDSDGRLDDGVPFSDLFRSAGAKYGIRPSILAAVAKVESAFNTSAVSPSGAEGLMQFMPATASAMGVDPYDPASAIDGAARYLSENLRRFGSLPLALAAYNAGPGAVQKAGGIPPFAETQKYVPAVLGLAGMAASEDPRT